MGGKPWWGALWPSSLPLHPPAQKWGPNPFPNPPGAPLGQMMMGKAGPGGENKRPSLG